MFYYLNNDGCFSRVAAFGIAAVMAVAIVTAHSAKGFFMNWSGQQKGEGFEYHLLALGLALIVMSYGAGKAASSPSEPVRRDRCSE